MLNKDTFTFNYAYGLGNKWLPKFLNIKPENNIQYEVWLSESSVLLMKENEKT